MTERVAALRTLLAAVDRGLRDGDPEEPLARLQALLAAPPRDEGEARALLAVVDELAARWSDEVHARLDAIHGMPHAPGAAEELGERLTVEVLAGSDRARAEGDVDAAVSALVWGGAWLRKLGGSDARLIHALAGLEAQFGEDAVDRALDRSVPG